MPRAVPLALLLGLLACSAEQLGGGPVATGTGGQAETGGTTGAGASATGGGHPATGGTSGAGAVSGADAGTRPFLDGGGDASFDAAPCDGQIPCCWDGGCVLLI